MLYVEGGGTRQQKNDLRKGMKRLIQRSGAAVVPEVFASGPRSKAIENYRDARKAGLRAYLLVDSERSVSPSHQAGDDPQQWKPWDHLRDDPDNPCERPTGAQDRDAHLMVQTMEHWLLADPEALQRFYGLKFKAPPATGTLESLGKAEALKRLKVAAEDTPKRTYDKGDHAFQLLAHIDPGKLCNTSKWAARFFATLAEPTPTHGV